MGDTSEFSLTIRLFLKAYQWRKIDPVPWTPLRKQLSQSNRLQSRKGRNLEKLGFDPKATVLILPIGGPLHELDFHALRPGLAHGETSQLRRLLDRLVPGSKTSHRKRLPGHHPASWQNK